MKLETVNLEFLQNMVFAGVKPAVKLPNGTTLR